MNKKVKIFLYIVLTIIYLVVFAYVYTVHLLPVLHDYNNGILCVYDYVAEVKGYTLTTTDMSAISSERRYVEMVSSNTGKHMVLSTTSGLTPTDNNSIELYTNAAETVIGKDLNSYKNSCLNFAASALIVLILACVVYFILVYDFDGGAYRNPSAFILIVVIIISCVGAIW